MSHDLSIGDFILSHLNINDDDHREIIHVLNEQSPVFKLTDELKKQYDELIAQSGKKYLDIKEGDETMETSDVMKIYEDKKENKVLNLWYKKEYNKIVDKYEKKEKDYFNSIEIVKQYKELVENFETEMKALYDSVDNTMTHYIEEKCDSSMYQYDLNDTQLNDEFVEKFIKERNKKLKELKDLNEEIEAQLSLSNDLEYQLEVLTRYGIIDKKTKKMVD